MKVAGGLNYVTGPMGAGKSLYGVRRIVAHITAGRYAVTNVELLPGEEAVVVGRIRVDQPETKMGFYTGLIQDGVGFFQDKTGRTIIKVGF